MDFAVVVALRIGVYVDEHLVTLFDPFEFLFAQQHLDMQILRIDEGIDGASFFDHTPRIDKLFGYTPRKRRVEVAVGYLVLELLQRFLLRFYLFCQRCYLFIQNSDIFLLVFCCGYGIFGANRLGLESLDLGFLRFKRSHQHIFLGLQLINLLLLHQIAAIELLEATEIFRYQTEFCSSHVHLGAACLYLALYSGSFLFGHRNLQLYLFGHLLALEGEGLAFVVQRSQKSLELIACQQKVGIVDVC